MLVAGTSIPSPLAIDCVNREGILYHRPKFALEWGEDPPKPPSSLKGVKYALEWGEDPPNPPLHSRVLNMPYNGGRIPPNPPLGARGPNMP